MPVYEWRCPRCEISFEALARLNESSRVRNCPRCGRAARRVISSFAIGSRSASATASAKSVADDSEWAAYRLPPAARFCWMDDKAAERMGAYQAGRGAEYDEKQAMNAETRRQRGEPEPAKPPAGTDIRVSRRRHTVNHAHGTSAGSRRSSQSAAASASKPQP